MTKNGVAISDGMTYAEYARKHGIKIDTMRKRYADRYGTGFSRNDLITEEFMFDTDTVAEVVPKSAQPKEASIVVVPPYTEEGDKPYDPEDDAEDEPFKQAGWGFTRLDLINYSEMALIFLGIYLLFGYLALIVAAMVVLFFWDVLITVKDPEAYESASFGILMAFLIAIGSGFIHYFTALKFVQESPMNAHFPLSDTWMAVVVAVVISGISFSAILQSRNKTTDRI